MNRAETVELILKEFKAMGAKWYNLLWERYKLMTDDVYYCKWLEIIYTEDNHR